MTTINSFKLLAKPQAQILILGSMPSVTSLEKQQYYAHPRNAFWRIMLDLFNDHKPLSYEQGEALLKAQDIAVWDVLESCVRQGSLDSAIQKQSIKVNDFAALFKAFPRLHTIFFNGGAAETLYKKNVLPELSLAQQSIKRIKLPSTSPAYAAMSYEDKLAAWQLVKASLVLS
ncbi:MAG: DNA-deoxyinosine glycosylase [Methyloprofundus sp.]|nr:DNA-deoxyinosine glycosylase [Methyloprofundus sp.]